MALVLKGQRNKVILGAVLAFMALWVALCFLGMKLWAERLTASPPSVTRLNQLQPDLQPLTAGNMAELETVARWGAGGEVTPSDLDLMWGAGGEVAWYSPDGRWLGFIGEDHLRLHDAQTLAVVQYLPFEPLPFLGGAIPREPAWSPDSTMVALISGGDTVLLYRLADGQLLQTLTGQEETTVLAFSPDSTLLAVGGGERPNLFASPMQRTIDLWHVADGRRLRTIKAAVSGRYLAGLGFSPDGSLLVSGIEAGGEMEEPPIRLWRVADGQAVAALETPGLVDYFTPRFAWNHSGSLLIASSQVNNVASHLLWRVDQREPLEVLEGEGTLHPSGEYFVQRSDVTLRVWSLKTDSPTVAYEQEGSFPGTLRFIGEGARFLLTAPGQGLEVWHFGPDGVTQEMSWEYSEKDGDFHPTPLLHPTRAEFVASRGESGLAVWDIATGGSRSLALGHVGSPFAVAFSPDGRLVASGSEDGRVILWEGGTGRQLQRLDHEAAVHDVAFSPDGSLLATIENTGQLTLWQVVAGQQGARFGNLAPFEENTVETNNLHQLAFSPDGAWLASNTAAGTHLWSVPNGSLAHSFAGGADAGLAFHPDGSLLAAGQPDGSVFIWSLADRSRVLTLRGDLSAYPTPALAFSPDGAYLAAGSSAGEGKSHVWSSHDWSLLNTFDSALGEMEDAEFLSWEWTEVAWHPTEPFLLVGEYGGAIVWEVPSGRQLAVVPIGRQEIFLIQLRTAAWSPTGDHIAYGFRDYNQPHPFVEILGVRTP